MLEGEIYLLIKGTHRGIGRSGCLENSYKDIEKLIAPNKC